MKKEQINYGQECTDKDRIKRLQRHHEIIKCFTSFQTQYGSLFSEAFGGVSKILIFSALIGYSTNRFNNMFLQEKSTEPLGEAVQIINFNQIEKNIIDLIAFNHTKDQNIIRYRKKYDIFSGYAAAGFDCLLEYLEIDPNITNIQFGDLPHEAIAKKLLNLIINGSYHIQNELDPSLNSILEI